MKNTITLFLIIYFLSYPRSSLVVAQEETPAKQAGQPAAVKKNFSAKAVGSLTRQVKKFLNYFYIKRNEAKFRSFIADRSPVLQLDFFKKSFDEDIKPDRPDFYVGYIEQDLNKLGVQCRNSIQTDGFCVVDGEHAQELFNYLFDGQIRIIDDGKLDDFLFVVYIVEGGGVKKKGIVIPWFKENDVWKIYGFEEFGQAVTSTK